MADLLLGYGATSPIEVLATGLDLEQFEGGDGRRFRAMHGIPEDRPVLLHVGRVAFEKNIGFILDAFSDVREKVPDALLVVAGEGPALQAMRKRTIEGCDPVVEAKKYEELVDRKALAVLRWNGMSERAAKLRIPVYVKSVDDGKLKILRGITTPEEVCFLAEDDFLVVLGLVSGRSMVSLDWGS